MLNRNLDLDIEYYISVDFAALTKVVDLLGGIYIDVDEAEISHLNNYTEETSKVTGVSTTKLTKTGLQLLDGVQATSYCRIRYTAGDDYKRTERQREVIMELVNTAKKADISKINEIINTVFPMIATNYSNDQLISLASEMLGYEIVDTTGFPFEKTSVTVSGKGSCVVPIDLADNVKQLHEYLFENYDYTPSSEVQSISDEITKETGY
jgi:anionic cell wall polymer biosynthesis LytR-Cps2A-Psr (LCP) family protein